MSASFGNLLLYIVAPIALLIGALLPDWAIFLGIISLAKGLVVLGLMLLWRTGLVSFGQGLFYGAGAYTVGVLPQYVAITDALLLVAISAIDLLKSFMNIPKMVTPEQENVLMWKVIIHMAFVISGLIFAYMDKVAGDTVKH